MTSTSRAHPYATITRVLDPGEKEEHSSITRAETILGHPWGHTWPPVDTCTATTGALAVAIDTRVGVEVAAVGFDAWVPHELRVLTAEAARVADYVSPTSE